MFDINRLAAMQVGLASPEKIREWSTRKNPNTGEIYGEVKKPETINYRSQKPERDGLFCERIFGPTKDYECFCGKYKKIRYKNKICEKCGVEVTTKNVRRERMGRIELASPVAHIWYLKGTPSRMALVLDISPKELEEVVYFISHITTKEGILNINGVEEKVFHKRQVIDERLARELFPDVITKILETLNPESSEYSTAQEYLDKIQNPKETFDFYTYSNFISKYTGAEWGIGAEAVKRLLEEVDLDEEFENIQKELREKSTKRDKLIKRLGVIEAFRSSGNKPEWMILDVLPVIPPELRPMLQLDGGRFASSDLNDLYRRVITRNLRLKKLKDINAPSVILMNEKRMLQEAVDALIDNGRRSKPVTGTSSRPLKSLSHALKGKQGRFRQNLLGKRVDYSGRSVIAVGPDLKMNQCGIPREMAVQLFKPFIAHQLISRGLANGHKAAEKLIEQSDERIWDIVEEVIKDHPVLLNRAPTLHRLGIQAFYPKLVKGRAIRLHPLVTPAFNADFDGDQMAVHVPLAENAITEAKELMLGSKNILGPKDGKPIVTPGQDMVLGNYYLTLEETAEEYRKRAEIYRTNGEYDKAELFELYADSEGKVFRSPEEAIKAYETNHIHLHNRIAVKASGLSKTCLTPRQKGCYLLTTVGKLIFNQIFPDKYNYLNRVDDIESENTGTDEDYVEFGTNVKEVIASRPLNKPFAKKHLGLIINVIFNYFGTEVTAIMLDKLKDQGFKYATLSSVTVAISDIDPVENKDELLKTADLEVEKIQELYNEGLLTKNERHYKIIGIWEGVKNQIQKQLTAQLARDKRNPIFIMGDSGARGNAQHFTQLSGMRGLMNNPAGEIIELPIKSSFSEGLSVSEYFISTHGARKGGADTALKTAESGYLTRRLVDVAQDVIVREEDCGTDHGFKVTGLYDENDTSVVDLTLESVVGRVSAVNISDPNNPNINILHRGEYINKEKNEILKNSGITKVTIYMNKIESLDERLAGRYSMRDVIHPLTGEILVKAGDVIDDNVAKRIYLSGVSEVEVRNLFGCISKDGVCVKCYGRNLATGDVVKVGEAVGIMAAQSIGEPGTQLTMRTFHTGGVAGGADITQGLPRVQELFEARNPKGEAIISEIAGEVVEISKDTESGKSNVVVQHVFDKKTKTITSNEIAFENFEYLVGTKFEDHGKTILTGLNEEEVLVEIPGTIVDVSKDETNVTIIINISDNPIKRVNNPVVNVDLKNNSTNKYNVTVKYVEEKAYTTPFNSTLRVKLGDSVLNGDKITEGAINPKKLLEVSDATAVQRYILKEVQKVYRLQGIEISDKHIEVVVRQMLKKMVVLDGGDTELLPGTKVDIHEFTNLNNDILLKGNRPIYARPLLLGITKASLETESFLSAASFQETTRVLTDAATKGKIDNLHGLKENVIIGKIIPAGTGFELNQSDDSNEEVNV